MSSGKNDLQAPNTLIIPFPNDKILDSSNFKEFEDGNFRFNENGEDFSKRIENTMGKVKIARYELLRTTPSDLNWMNGIGWLNGVLRRFQQYFRHITATVHIIHVFPGKWYWMG